MKKIVFLLTALLCALCLLGGCEKQPNAFDLNRSRLVGSWLLTTYTDRDGVTHDFSGEQVRFVYRADGTAEKTVRGAVEYTATYSYDGEHLYTSAAYPDTEGVQLMHDLCTATDDTLQIYSYDEGATIILKKDGT